MARLTQAHDATQPPGSGKHILMKLARFSVLIVLVLSAQLWAQSTVSTANPGPQTGPKTPEQQLRALFYRGDASLLERDGEALATAKGASLETRAWFVPIPMQGKSFFTALSLLDGMKKEAPDSAWTLATRTFFTADLEQAIALCDKAVAKDSREDILLLCTRGVNQQLKTADDAKLFSSFVTKHREGFEKSALGLVAEGRALNRIHRLAENKMYNDDATALFDEALKREPASEVAIAAKYYDLDSRKRYKEAADLFERNASHIESESLHINYFQSLVTNIPGLGKEDKAKRVEATERTFIERAEPSTEYVGDLISKLSDFSKSAGNGMMDFIQQRYPNTQAARQAKLELITKDLDLEDVDQTPAEKRKQIAVQLLDFVKQSLAAQDSDAAREALGPLYMIATRNDVASDQLLQAVTASPEDSHGFMQLLADRKSRLNEIEPIAAAQVERVTRELETDSLLCMRDLPEMKASNLKWSWAELANWEDTLGWIYLQQGRLIDADRKLTAAEGLLDMPIGMGMPGNIIDQQVTPLVHLGRLYTAKGDFAKADEYLSRAMSVESFDLEHPAIAAYKDLYLKQHGSDTGIEQYLAKVTEKDAERRKAKILSERITDAKPIPSFKLTRVDGKTISSDDLKGKIAVINFWGTWCGPCKFELPEIQKFADKFKDNPNVVFVAIDAKDSLDQVKNFMAEKKYNFPVLMEGDYLNTAKIQGFPTTWFIDRDGKKVFEKMGSSKRVVEEFTWRVEAMLGSTEPNSHAAPNTR